MKTIFIRYSDDGYTIQETTIKTGDFELIDLLVSATDPTKIGGILRSYAASFEGIDLTDAPDLTVAPPLKNRVAVEKMLSAMNAANPRFA